MIRVLGKLLWKQSRDICVYNYPYHTLFEIYTNQGFLRIIQEKSTDRIEVLTPKNQKQYVSGSDSKVKDLE